MKNSLLFTALLAFSVSLSSSFAQEVIPAKVENAKGVGGSVSYSVRQVFYYIHTGEDGSVAEDVQQPYEISVVTAVVDAEGIDLVVSAYPKPVTDYLILRVDLCEHEGIIYQLFDANGRMIKIGEAVDPETIIDMTGLSSAIYILKVVDRSEEIKTFRII